MTTYITLAEFTREAIQNVSDSPELIDLLETRADDLGGDLRDVFVTLGEYDMVVVSEFPTTRATRSSPSPSPTRPVSAPIRSRRSPETSTATSSTG